ncbi:MAG: hypothetical protein WC882_05710 [Candidatus Gracilibacteria bacterium]
MPPPEVQKETPKQTTIRALIDECLKHIDSYEKGTAPNLNIGKDWAKYEKPYHKRNHTDFVMQEIAQLLEAEQKNQDSPLAERKEENADLCRLFAGSHDYDQQENSSDPDYNGGNEKRSLTWLIPKMVASGQFTAEDIEIAKIAELGTWTPVVGKGTETHLQQVVREFGTGKGPAPTLQTKMEDLASKYGISIDPQIFRNPRAIAIAKLLADADLATLGNEWDVYWENMMLFFREQHPEINQNSNTSDARETWGKYLQFQVNLLNNHHYHTQVAQNRYPHCPTNSAEVSGILTNNETFNASFEAMLKMNGTYKPQAKTMSVINA